MVLMKPSSVGWIDISIPGQWNVRVDGVSYGWLPWTLKPIAPGTHTLDLLDHKAMRHVRCNVDIKQGQRLRALVGTNDNCVVAEIRADDAS